MCMLPDFSSPAIMCTSSGTHVALIFWQLTRTQTEDLLCVYDLLQSASWSQVGNDTWRDRGTIR